MANSKAQWEMSCVIPPAVHPLLQFLGMLALSSEFENIAVREEELPELDALSRSACPVDIKGGAENKHGKVNVLLQVHDLPHPASWLLEHSRFFFYPILFHH